MDQLQQYLTERMGEAVQIVYTQPPSGMQMVYPCLIITVDTGVTLFADNNPYRHLRRYMLTGVSNNLDESKVIYDVLKSLPRCRHSRSFPVDNLIHDVFSIFFEEETE